MGFFRRLFGAKNPAASPSPPAKDKKWSFARSSNKRGASSNPYDDSLDANKHAIAVAAATAAVAEAALAAAQAAAEVVRLTSGGGEKCTASPLVGGSECSRRFDVVVAAVKIQSAFRSYLARRALRALKALVKLQALVRGHIVRKQTADMLRRMQTLVRLQTRARATRALMSSESWHSTTNSNHSRRAVPGSPHKDCLPRAYSSKFDGPSVLKRCSSNSNFREIINLDEAKMGSNWFDCWMEESLWNNCVKVQHRNQHAGDDANDKILEVDTWKPHMKSQQSSRTFRTTKNVLAPGHDNKSFMINDSASKLSTKGPSLIAGVSFEEVLSSVNSLNLPLGKDEVYKTAENSPRVNSALLRPVSNGRRGPFTPTRSECSWGFFNEYSGYPNYMGNTESSRAKVRSQSAPRQRLEFEKHGLSKRSLQGFHDSDTNSERGFNQHNDFRHKAYPASGRSHRLGSTNLR